MEMIVELYSERKPEELERLLSIERSPLEVEGESKTGIIYTSKSDKKVRLHLSGIRTDNNKRMADVVEGELGFSPQSVLYYKVEKDNHTRRESNALGSLTRYLLNCKEPLFILRYLPITEDEEERISTGRASFIGLNTRTGQNLVAEDVHMGRDYRKNKN